MMAGDWVLVDNGQPYAGVILQTITDYGDKANHYWVQNPITSEIRHYNTPYLVPVTKEVADIINALTIEEV